MGCDVVLTPAVGQQLAMELCGAAKTSLPQIRAEASVR